MALLITGASGMVGVELVRALLARPSPPPLRLLLRGSPAEVEAKRRWILAWAGPLAVGADVLAVGGDVSQPGLGLDPITRDRLRAEVTGVLHSAADTGFEVAESTAYATNVEGTRQVLALAAACPRLDRVGVVGTAYVAGRRTGYIYDADPPSGDGFFNVYERSKAAAEAEVRARARDLPAAIYRLGLTVGRRSDGAISRFGVVYSMWDLVHQGLAPMFPGDPDAPLDLVPVDFASAAMIYLLLDGFSPGASVQVVAGPERSYTLGAFFPALVQAIRDAEPGWEREGYPTPMCVDPATFASFVDTVDLVANRRLRQVAQVVRAFTRQMGAPKWFDAEGLHARLSGSGLALAPARDWLPVLVRHAVEQRFRQPRREVP